MIEVVTTHGSNVSDMGELEEFEQRLSKRLFDLSESLLQLSMTDWSGCYTNVAQRERLSGLLELAKIATLVKEK